MLRSLLLLSAAPSESKRSKQYFAQRRKDGKGQEESPFASSAPLREISVDFLATLLPQAPTGRCSDYRATQKGRGWLELVYSGLTALGLKVRGHGNEQHGRKDGLPSNSTFSSWTDGIFERDEGAEPGAAVVARRQPPHRPVVRSDCPR